jgi:hypothetical protein
VLPSPRKLIRPRLLRVGPCRTLNNRVVVHAFVVNRHPDDIDLFSGAISEYPEGQGLLGPTIACLLSQQFNKLKFGDRFWFETNDPYTGFTLGRTPSNS